VLLPERPRLPFAYFDASSFRKCMLRTGINHCGVFNALAGFVIFDNLLRILNELIHRTTYFHSLGSARL
jgi:hypothetical protein